jgi:hypothetical protein
MANPSFLRLLKHTVSTERATETVTSVGGHKKVYAANLTGLKCRIQPLPILQRENAQFRMWMNTGVDILQDDLITFNSKKYLVRFVGDPGGQGHHQAAELIETPGNN